MEEKNMNLEYEEMGVEEMRAQIAVLTRELDATADQLTRTEQALNDASEQLVAAELERDTVQKQNAQLTEELSVCQQQILDLKQKNIDDTRRHQKAIQSIMRCRAESYLTPGITTAICAVLAVLVNLGVKHQLVAAILGIPLAAVCVLTCTFCLGVIVERVISWNFRKPEVTKRHEVHRAK